MPDGQGYSGNAQKAAAHASQCSKNGCPNCVKQGLPVLLTIPTLADKTYASTQHGTIAKLLKGTADPELTYSGYITRTLRQGYVMAWYENPPKCMAHEDGWIIARVDAGGFMTQTTFAALGLGSAKGGSKSKTKDEPFSCSRASSYAAAMLFVVPEAKTAGKVWIAFSDHPWSPGVRKKYAGGSDAFRQKAMTCVDASQASCERSIKLTKANIRGAVPDCLSDFDATHIAGNPFPPPHVLSAVTVTATPPGAKTPAKAASNTGDDAGGMDTMMLDEARKALGSGGDLTLDDAMIVCLPDPEGITTTAAQRRITLCNSAADWAAQFRDDEGVANGAWRLQSALTVKGLLKIFDQQAAKHIEQEAKYDASYRGQECTQADFARLKGEDKLPPDATLKRVPEFDTPISAARGTPTGWHEVIAFPTDWAINMQRDRMKEQVVERLTGTAQGMGWQAFLDEHQRLAKVDHDLLAEVELDHKAWLQSDAFDHHHTHNFDDTDPRDGVAYASCASHCLMGGPISKDALAWWKDFLADDPNAKRNLLMRAMLGNQKKYFDWITSTDQKATAYDEARGLLDVVAAAREKGGHASSKEAEGVAQSLLSTAGALAARMDEAKTLSSALRGRLKRLGLGLIVRSESHLFLYKLRVPVGVAGKLWRGMADTAQVVAHKTVESGGRKIKSLVLGGAMALELEGSPKAANALVDVYLWSRGKVKVEVGKVEGTFKLTTTEVLGEGQTPFAAGLTEETAEALSKNSMRLLRGAGSGLLSAGSGFLQVLILGEAWEKLEHGTEEDQKAAAVTLLTSGIGIGAACMEISGLLAKQFEKEALEKGLKMAAGRASAVGTFVVAVQSLYNAYSALGRGDKDVAAALGIQGLFFLAATGAGYMAASAAVAGTEATAIAFGLTWTGIGLIFVALGVLAGFVILILKDTPLEAWAAESIWGEASDKYASLAREQEALNEALIGAEVDFSYGVFSEGTFWSNLLSNIGASQYNRSAALTGQPLMAQTLEAQLRLIVPKLVIKRLPWLLEIHASRRGQGVVKVAHWDSTGTVSAEGDHAALGLYEASHKQEVVAGNDKATSLELSVRLDISQYHDAFATVRLADSSTDAKAVLAGTGSYIIEYEHLSS